MKAAVHTLLGVLAIVASGRAAGDTPPRPTTHEPASFLFVGQGDLDGARALLARPDIQGAQVVYAWKTLEPTKDHYDFSAIEHDLALVRSLHKELFVQVQDRFFRPKARNLPAYLLDDPIYGGGLAPQKDKPGRMAPTTGWVAMQWNPHLRARFQKLLAALGRRFDGRIYGVNLPESSADLSDKAKLPGFTCDAYFAAELDNMKALRRAFTKSYVVQYVNFWPCEWNDDHHYMRRAFAYASAHHIGLGGPDIVPWRKGQMKNSYPFFHAYRGKLPLVAMAVQEPTLTYLNPKTKRPFTRAELVRFARDYLGVDVIFWSVESPWLSSPPRTDPGRRY